MSILSATLSNPRLSRIRAGTRSAITGIDIGAHSVKLVTRRYQAGRWHVICASRLRLPEAVLGDARALVGLLGPWLHEQCTMEGGRCVLTLPAAMVDYESIEGAPGSGDAAYDLANREIQRLLGDEAERAASDYWCSQLDGNGPRSLYLTWTASEFVAQLADGLAQLGWHCVAVDAPAVALARVNAAGFAGEAEPGTSEVEVRGSRLIADIGSQEATLVWSRMGGADYIREGIRYASASAADTLATAWRVRTEVAEELLAQWGLGEGTETSANHLEAALASQLGDWLQRLLFEFRRTLQYLHHHYGENSVGEVVLCGGGACIRGLAEWLTTRLGIPVKQSSLPSGWRWDTATPYSSLFAEAVALTQYGEA